jgi:hypothetical protein
MKAIELQKEISQLTRERDAFARKVKKREYTTKLGAEKALSKLQSLYQTVERARHRLISLNPELN